MKLGDRVRFIGHKLGPTDRIEYTNAIGSIGILVPGMYKYSISFENDSLNTVEDGTRRRFAWSYEDLKCFEYPTVQDSKLARNLYKNQIDKIENGKIYLK